MRVSIDSFLKGIKCCQQSMNVMREAVVTLNEDGEPAICRTTHFVECELKHDNKRYLLSMPLSDDALRLCENNIALFSTINSDLLGDYRLLREEMSYTTWQGTEHRVDLLLFEIPYGVTLQEYISNGENTDALSGSVDNMLREFKRIELCHHNLHASNIIVDKYFRLFPMRLHDIRRGQNEEIDASFVKLKEYIEVNALWKKSTEGIELHDYNVMDEQHNFYEGILCVKSGDNSYHYEDEKGNALFDGRTFLWASDFKEGRAEVEREQGMGLINKDGEYILKPHYEIVDYDVMSGYSRVKLDGLWALYDYEGQEILSFEDRIISDDDIALIKLK